jgi:hypothetical protein
MRNFFYIRRDRFGGIDSIVRRDRFGWIVSGYFLYYRKGIDMATIRVEVDIDDILWDMSVSEKEDLCKELIEDGYASGGIVT